jgi:putative oxidoreductase
MNDMQNAILLLGRVLASAIFVWAGWGKLMAPAATQAMLAGHGLPLVQVAWALSVAVELGGGLAILFGGFTRFAAIVLAAWCIATALIAHTNFADRNMEINFMKNVAMAGGFLYVFAFGAGAWSLDGAMRRRPVPVAR